MAQAPWNDPFTASLTRNCQLPRGKPLGKKDEPWLTDNIAGQGNPIWHTDNGNLQNYAHIPSPSSAFVYGVRSLLSFPQPKTRKGPLSRGFPRKGLTTFTYSSLNAAGFSRRSSFIHGILHQSTQRRPKFWKYQRSPVSGDNAGCCRGTNHTHIFYDS